MSSRDTDNERNPSLPEPAPDDGRTDLAVKLVDARDDTVVAENVYGETVAIHRSIFRDNGIVVVDGRASLPRSVYEHYYGRRHVAVKARRAVEDAELLARNVGRLQQHEAAITARPEMSRCCSSICGIGGIPIGLVGYLSLGLLLELWHDPRFRAVCPDCDGSGCVYRFTGSFLSGRCHVTAVCPECARSFSQESRSRGRSAGQLLLAIEEAGVLVQTDEPGVTGRNDTVRVYAARRTANWSGTAFTLPEVIAAIPEA
jgi:hypothetical protein